MGMIQHINFQKGCYTGQEVIARLHYRGEVKKRLQLITSLSELTVGSEINSEGLFHFVHCTNSDFSNKKPVRFLVEFSDWLWWSARTLSTYVDREIFFMSNSQTI